ncbi:hypothetical protein BGZ96_012536 [Linnemannia gamsii]|uniref:Uncharacterized protein n=1 Tax=Linnemannia gamsii TaxID=64522 RepID=A0ABQ7JQH1_9FUNG|nr:hypothetical protein BGZ96_012536 [Linnemannia gamsii]
MDANWADFFNGVPSRKDNESTITTAALVVTSPNYLYNKTMNQKRQNNDDVSNTTRTQPSHLPSPSPELSNARAMIQGHAYHHQPVRINSNKMATATPPQLPSPSPELAHVQARARGHIFQQQQPLVSRNNNNIAIKTTVSTPTYTPSLSTSSPELTVILPWMDNEDDILDSLLDTYTTEPLSKRDARTSSSSSGVTFGYGFSSAARYSLELEIGTSQLSSTLGLGTSETDFGRSAGVVDPFARYGHSESNSSMGHGSNNSRQQSKGDQDTACLTNEELVRILLTPDPELINAVRTMRKTTSTEPCATSLPCQPRSVTVSETVKDSTVGQDKTTMQGKSMSLRFSTVLSRRDSAASISVPTIASRRSIRFDPTPPCINVLDRHRVKGPPFRPGDEKMDVALQRARREYLADNEFRQQHDIEKRTSLNAQLHAVFPVLAQDEQQSSKQHANKKRAIRTGNIDEYTTEQPAAKRTCALRRASSASSSSSSLPAISTFGVLSQGMSSSSEHTIKHQGAMEDSTMENATLHFSTINHATNERNNNNTINHHTDFLSMNNYTTNSKTTETISGDVPPKHPEFDDMVTDNETVRTLRKARWELNYPMVDAVMWQEDTVGSNL